MFQFRSHGSRDIRYGAKPWLEGAHALLRRLSRGHEVNAPMRLSQAARSRHAGLHARPELPAVAPGVAPHVSGLRKSPGNSRVRTADQSSGSAADDIEVKFYAVSACQLSLANCASRRSWPRLMNASTSPIEVRVPWVVSSRQKLKMLIAVRNCWLKPPLTPCVTRLVMFFRPDAPRYSLRTFASSPTFAIAIARRSDSCGGSCHGATCQIVACLIAS